MMRIERLEELVEFNNEYNVRGAHLHCVVLYKDIEDDTTHAEDYHFTINDSILGGEFNPYKFLMVIETNNYEIIDAHIRNTKEQEVLLHYMGHAVFTPISWVFERKEDADEKLLWIGYEFFEKGEKYYREKLLDYLRKGDTK